MLEVSAEVGDVGALQRRSVHVWLSEEMGFAVEAARRKKRNAQKQAAESILALQIVLVGLFAPLVIWFFYSIATDPALPGLMRQVGRNIKYRFSTFLGPAPKYKLR